MELWMRWDCAEFRTQESNMSTFDPFQQLEQLLGKPAAAAPVVFAANSRYYNTPIVTLKADDGTETACLLRRFVPQPEAFATMGTYQVGAGDRLDNVAAQLLNDPELYWQLCDANRALQPEELEVVGRKLRITLPQGIPAPQSNG
jgi:hypothetical protein